MTIFQNFSEITVHFSDVLKTPIFLEDGKKLGRLTDLFVDYEEVYPQVLAIQYQTNRYSFYIEWNDIIKFNYKKIIIKKDAIIGRSRVYPKATNKKIVTSLLAGQFSGKTIEFPGLRKIVLDRQIVDTSGKKVVRVNDIQFIKASGMLRVTHAEIGLRSMVRRLGMQKVIDSIFLKFNKNAKYLTNETLINWKFVHAIPNRSVQPNVKLNLSNEDIKNLHPADLADILEDLDHFGRDHLFKKLDPKFAAETLSEIEQDIQRSLIKSDSPEHMAKIIENMDTDDAADALSDLSGEQANEIISNIEDNETQEEIQELLEYDEDTAGGLMSTEFFEISPHLKKSEILDLIIKEHEEFETIYDLYIINEEQILLGTCSLRELLIQKEDIMIKEIMNTDDIKSLRPNAHWKDVAKYMSKYNLLNVPILKDTSHELLGIVSVDDTLPWLLNER